MTIRVLECETGIKKSGMTWKVWVVLALIVVLAAALRIYRIDASSLWIDEFYSLEASAGKCYVDLSLPRNQMMDHLPRLVSIEDARSAAQIWTSMENDQHPPLYFILLRFWRDLFGSSDAATRSLSLVASLIALLLVFDVGQMTLGIVPGLWASGLMALAQPEIWYAQETRAYMVLTALIAGTASILLRIERRGLNGIKGMGLVAGLLAIMLTHYFGLAACMALGIYALVKLEGKVRVKVLAIMAGTAVIYCGIWGPFLWKQLHGYALNNGWLHDPSNHPLWEWGKRLLRVSAGFFAEPRRHELFPYASVILLVLPWMRIRRVPGLLLPALWGTGWVAFVAAIDLGRQTHMMNYFRYVVPAAPGFYLIAAGLLADEKRVSIRWAIPAALILYCLISLTWTFDGFKSDWREIGRAARDHVSNQDVMMIYSPGHGDWMPGVMCMDVNHYAPKLTSRTVFMNGMPLPESVMRQLRTAPKVWLICDVGDPDIDQLVRGFHAGEIYFGFGAAFMTQLIPDSSAAAKASPLN